MDKNHNILTCVFLHSLLLLESVLTPQSGKRLVLNLSL
jgi:hypothetical protein